jgi:hypothetical protein
MQKDIGEKGRDKEEMKKEEIRRRRGHTMFAN